MKIILRCLTCVHIAMLWAKIVSGLVAGIEGMYFYNDIRYENTLPDSKTTNLSTSFHTDVTSCAFLCQQNPKCLSFFYSPSLCVGYRYIMNDNINTMSHPGLKYYEISGPMNNIALGKHTLEGNCHTHVGVKMLSQEAVDGVRDGLVDSTPPFSCYMSTRGSKVNKLSVRYRILRKWSSSWEQCNYFKLEVKPSSG